MLKEFSVDGGRRKQHQIYYHYYKHQFNSVWVNGAF
jgi:hypothetical protein